MYYICRFHLAARIDFMTAINDIHNKWFVYLISQRYESWKLAESNNYLMRSIKDDGDMK